jgi:hypothetical protein
MGRAGEKRVKLYVVMAGEQGQGGRIRGIKTDQREAVILALSQDTHQEGLVWSETSEPLCWTADGDLVWIEIFDCADVFPTGFHYPGPGERQCQPVITKLGLLPESSSPTDAETPPSSERQIM